MGDESYWDTGVELMKAGIPLIGIFSTWAMSLVAAGKTGKEQKCTVIMPAREVGHAVQARTRGIEAKASVRGSSTDEFGHFACTVRLVPKWH